MTKLPNYVSASLPIAFLIWLAIPGDFSYFRILVGVLALFIMVDVVLDMKDND